MNYCNCEKCNKIFNYIRGPLLCNKCNEEVFNQIKNYINQNPNSTVYDINKDLNLPIKIVEEYIKEERIMKLRDNINLCSLCKDIVVEGNLYCKKCLQKIKILNGINSLPNSSKEVNHNIPKMHYFDNGRTRKR